MCKNYGSRQEVQENSIKELNSQQHFNINYGNKLTEPFIKKTKYEKKLLKDLSSHKNKKEKLEKTKPKQAKTKIKKVKELKEINKNICKTKKKIDELQKKI